MLNYQRSQRQSSSTSSWQNWDDYEEVDNKMHETTISKRMPRTQPTKDRLHGNENRPKKIVRFVETTRSDKVRSASPSPTRRKKRFNPKPPLPDKDVVHDYESDVEELFPHKPMTKGELKSLDKIMNSENYKRSDKDGGCHERSRSPRQKSSHTPGQSSTDGKMNLDEERVPHKRPARRSNKDRDSNRNEKTLEDRVERREVVAHNKLTRTCNCPAYQLHEAECKDVILNRPLFKY